MAEVSPDAALSQDAEALPFDIYQRYRLIHDIVETLCPGERLSILDVGGGEGHVRVFFPAARVVVLERGEVRGPAIRGDARCLPFRAGAFDAVVCSDVLEHLPKEGRRIVLEEMVRVARSLAVVGAPFWSEEVDLAEQIVSRFRQNLLGEEHPWLKEHRRFGLPVMEEVQAVVEGFGLPYRVLPNGHLAEWLAMKLLKQYLMALADNAVLLEQVSRFWNRSRYGMANKEPAYRYVVAILKQGGGASMRRLDALVSQPSGTGMGLSQVSELVASLAVQDRMRRALAARDAQITRLRETINEKDSLVRHLMAEGDLKQRQIELLRAEGDLKQQHIEVLRAEGEAKQRRFEDLESIRRKFLYRVFRKFGLI